MLSYCFSCDISEQLGANKLEDYEINNGMQVRWLNIDEAIAHNTDTMKNDENQGLSIQRETYLLREIKQQLMAI